MFLDKSRLADMEKLRLRYEDVSQPYKYREKAYRLSRIILKQLRDKKLAKLRRRLIAAKDDSYESAKIISSIKHYEKKEWGDIDRW